MAAFALTGSGFMFLHVNPLEGILSDYQYPYEVNFLNFKFHGEDLKMAYMDVKAQKSNGKAAILLHGKNFNGAYWEGTAKDLSAKGFRVVIPRSDRIWEILKTSRVSVFLFHNLQKIQKWFWMNCN